MLNIERAISMGQIFSQVDGNLWGDGYWMLDLYTDSGNDWYAIGSQGGKLYQFPLTVENGEAMLGDPVEVQHTFTPTNRSSITITRDADGTRRWTIIAATSVLNRVGEIDSRDLFDDFVSRTETEGFAYLSILHASEAFNLGPADFQHREGDLYINSGTFNEDDPIARAVADTLEDSDEEFGISIGYIPYAQPEEVEIADGIRVRVYRKGFHKESSILFENDAASLFTAVSVSRDKTQMTNKLRDTLKALLKDDKLVDEAMAKVEARQRTINDNKLITREDTTPPASDAPATEVLIDDQLMSALVEQVAAKVTENMQANNTALAEAVIEIDQLRTKLEASETRNGEFEKRLAALEKPEDQKRQDYQADLKRGNQQVIIRPRQPEPTVERKSGEPDYEVDLASVAGSTLKKIKGAQKPAPQEEI